MCMTTEPAHLSNTIIYAAEVRRDNQDYHVIGYQNKARSKGPNAMILPLPAAGPLGPANVVDTRKFKNILNAYDAAIERHRPKRRSRGLTKGFRMDSLSDSRGFQVFESGSYTIALSDTPQSMRLALEQVPAAKRPNIPGSFLASLAQLYKDWPMAICCFNGNLEAPEPLLWWFKPRFKHALFAPAIDAHDGNPPDPNVQVSRDHTLAFGSYQSQRPLDHALLDEIQQVPAEHQWLFVPSVIGTKVLTPTGNGDFSLPVSAIHDDKVPTYLPKIDITPPPRDLPSRYDHIMADATVS